MFGKRKGREPVQQPEPAPRKPSPTQGGVGRLGTVIVNRSALAKAGEPGNYALIQAVVNFTNAMTGDGLYTRFELPEKALQAFHADFYLAQVLNGGHSQFIHNSFGNLPFVITDVRAGLAGMRAEKILAIFERAAAWIAANPDEAKKQTGFEGGRAALLDELDSAFYDANKETPMIAQSSLWIKDWPELRAVDDADYVEAIRRVIMLNPLREERLLWTSIRNLLTQTMDWFQVGVRLACASMPEPAVVVGIGGGSIMEIEGAQQMAFLVRASGAQNRYCVVTNDHAAAYESIQPVHPMPGTMDADPDATARIARLRGRNVGKKLAHVKRETIAGIIELAGEYYAPAAIDLLLRKAGVDPREAMVSPATIEPGSEGPGVKWLILAGNEPFYGLSLPRGSVLLRPGQKDAVAMVTKQDAEAHAKRAAAGAIKAPE
jgi:hypothetical protein